MLDAVMIALCVITVVFFAICILGLL